jgi:D-galactose 1-dehydrogenase
MKPIRTGIVGLGKIAKDQHVPALRANPAFILAATASPHDQLPGVASFSNVETMLQTLPELDAVAICTPPLARYDAARLALAQGKHVLLEKPPCASIVRLEQLSHLAAASGRTLYTTWHSQYAPAVKPLALLLRERRVREIRIIWKEDVTYWHPGQRWLCEPGGFGVFDAGINALSILTRVLPEPIFARAARLSVPENWSVPSAAELEFETEHGVPISATLDFCHPGTPIWQITFATDRGPILLADGGATLTLDNQPLPGTSASLVGEYAAIYRRFEQLITRSECDVDARPLKCVADAFLVAQHIAVPPVEL